MENQFNLEIKESENYKYLPKKLRNTIDYLLSEYNKLPEFKPLTEFKSGETIFNYQNRSQYEVLAIGDIYILLGNKISGKTSLLYRKDKNDSLWYTNDAYMEEHTFFKNKEEIDKNKMKITQESTIKDIFRCLTNFNKNQNDSLG